MARVILLVVWIACLLATPLRAIEMNGTYDTTAPTESDIPNWTTGWGASNLTGWNYVGQINGASGVYLGNGWVLTAGHVGYGNFTLGGVTYMVITNSVQAISDSYGTADLTLFQIESPPNLPSLILSTSPPTVFSSKVAGSSVAMLGYGGNYGLTWGLDIVTETNEEVPLTGTSYTSLDFFTDNGTVNRGASSITNNSTVVDGDSGGADFIYNATTGKWELAGINEITGDYSNYSGTYYGNGTFSGFVQLSSYASEINPIINPVDSPAMPWPALLGLGFSLALAAMQSGELRGVKRHC
jgi:hypothetical protein